MGSMEFQDESREISTGANLTLYSKAFGDQHDHHRK